MQTIVSVGTKCYGVKNECGFHTNYRLGGFNRNELNHAYHLLTHADFASEAIKADFYRLYLMAKAKFSTTNGCGAYTA